jgi:hypothetical protein
MVVLITYYSLLALSRELKVHNSKLKPVKTGWNSDLVCCLQSLAIRQVILFIGMGKNGAYSSNNLPSSASSKNGFHATSQR